MPVCIPIKESTVTLMDAYQHHVWRIGETCNTLTAGQNNSIRGDTPLCVFDITGTNSNSMKSPTPDSCFRQRDVARTLDSFVASPECNQGGNVVVQAYTADCRNGALNEELSGTLQAKPNGGFSYNYIKPAMYDARGNGDGKTSPCLTGDHQNRVTDYTALSVYPAVTGPLMANSHPGSYTGQDAFNGMLPVVPNNKPPRKYIVRRLTPLECCRLQGFPDWWEDGVEGSDSARYKMWGNGMALPNMLHVMRGIARIEGSNGR